MLQPIRTKFRKQFKGRIHGTATSGAKLSFGQYGLKALEPDRVTARHDGGIRARQRRHVTALLEATRQGLDATGGEVVQVEGLVLQCDLPAHDP